MRIYAVLFFPKIVEIDKLSKLLFRSLSLLFTEPEHHEYIMNYWTFSLINHYWGSLNDREDPAAQTFSHSQPLDGLGMGRGWGLYRSARDIKGYQGE